MNFATKNVFSFGVSVFGPRCNSLTFCSLSHVLFLVLLLPDDVEFEVSSDRRTGKPIAVKLVKIKAEVLPEERISGQVGPDLHASPFTMLHGYIHPHPVKEHIFSWLCFLSSSHQCSCMYLFIGEQLLGSGSF